MAQQLYEEGQSGGSGGTAVKRSVEYLKGSGRLEEILNIITAEADIDRSVLEQALELEDQKFLHALLNIALNYDFYKKGIRTREEFEQMIGGPLTQICWNLESIQ